MGTGLGSHLRRLVLHRHPAREASRVMCVAELIMYQWSKLRMMPAWYWVRFSSNSVLATVLFDSRASHSFITDQFVAKYNLSMSTMKNPLIVSTPGGEMKTGHISWG
jgi:hypothetical protein